MRFVYVFDSNQKDRLLSHGFKVVQEQKTGNNNPVWLLACEDSMFFELEDSSKATECIVNPVIKF